MLYMVIEHFHEGAAPEVYKRFRENGRMMPDGLNYVASWIEPTFRRCYQVMEWDDLMDFETIPVVTSADAQALMRNPAKK